MWNESEVIWNSNAHKTVKYIKWTVRFHSCYCAFFWFEDQVTDLLDLFLFKFLRLLFYCSVIETMNFFFLPFISKSKPVIINCMRWSQCKCGLPKVWDKIHQSCNRNSVLAEENVSVWCTPPGICLVSV